MNFDLLITCPYDKSHLIYESKMQLHLFKCERNHKNTKKIICPFNSTHWLDNTEYMLHINIWPNGQVIEAHKYDIDRGQVLRPQPFKDRDLPTPEENWDDENI